MKAGTNKTRLISFGLTLLVALVILADFSIPGKEFTEEVISVKQDREQYGNAGGNYHYSYKLVTAKHQFSVSEAFAQAAKKQKVNYAVSRVFQEVNRHGVVNSGSSTIYSLRLVSGLVLPLAVMLVLALVYTLKKRWNTFIFILQMLVLADFGLADTLTRPRITKLE